MARMRRMRTREARIRVEFCAEATEDTRWCAAVPGAAASCHITLSFLCGGSELGGTATVRPCIAPTSYKDIRQIFLFYRPADCSDATDLVLQCGNQHWMSCSSFVTGMVT